MCTSMNNYQEAEESTWTAVKRMLISLLYCLVIKIHYLFDCTIDFVFNLYYRGKEKKVPPVKNPLVLESALNIAEKIRNKKVSAEVVVRTFIDRCKEVNDVINAIVDERYKEAIEEARKIDELLACDIDIEILKITKPFLGVPFTTKESNEAEGMLHSVGMMARKGHRSSEDSSAVAQMKDSGAILIAKTNVPELNVWVESRNLVYGQTNNPYNTTRTVGGSSGGDGAIVAACGVPFALGSDIGGSIRIPAFCNGVFGFKPSAGTTPLKGIGLRTKNKYPNSMVEAGILCKRIEDMIPLTKFVLTDKTLQDKLNSPVNIKKLRVFYQENSGDLRASKMQPEMQEVLLKAVSHMRQVTGTVDKIKLPGSEFSFKLWKYWMTQEEADFKLDITNGAYRTNANSELCKLLTNQSTITLSAIFKIVDEDFFPKVDKQWAESVTNKMKDFLVKKLGNNGVLLYPSSPYPPGYHYTAFLRPFNFGYFALFNVLRVPVCQVPMGLDSEGVPIGIQVVAAPNEDHLCIAVAQELATAFGGFVPPSGTK